MDNVHRDYLLKRFREERDSLMSAITRDTEYSLDNDRMLMMVIRFRTRCEAMFGEIEFQINRAFDDMEKERAKKEGGAA